MALFPELQLNSTGAAVTRWQNFLKRQNLLNGNADGQFGIKTDEATKKYQTDQQLKDDGIVGNATYTQAIKDRFNGGVREIRGVWLTNVDSNVFDSSDNIKEALERLKAMNFNTLYPAVWNRGYTLYPSNVAKDFFGVEVMPKSKFPESNFEGRDMLEELIMEAKKLNLRIIPWFEYGLMALPNLDLAIKHDDLLMRDRRKKIIRLKSHDKDKPDEHVWLNPCRPEVQEFMVNLIVDVVERYPEIDGIQLDDHFGIPVEMSYDDFTINLYQQEKETAENPNTNPDSSNWRNWRTDKVTQLLQQIFKAVKNKRGNCIVSISPNPLKFSKDNYLADWKKWENEGIAEEIVLQVYRNSVNAFAGELDKSEIKDCCNHIPTSIGILSGIKGTSVNFSPLIQGHIEATRNRDFAGFSFFSYETIINKVPMQPDSVNPKQRELAFINVMPPLA